MGDDAESLPDKTTWTSVKGVIVTGSFMRDGDGLSVLVATEEGAKTRVRGRFDLYSALISEAVESDGEVIFQGVITEAHPDGACLDVRILGPVTLTGKVSELTFSREGDAPRVSFWMTREVMMPTGEIGLIPTGVNVFGPDASALSGLRAGDRVSLQARHGEDGFLAVSPVTVLDQDDTDPPSG